MKKNIYAISAILILHIPCGAKAKPRLLPEKFTVWVSPKKGGGESVINYKIPGSQERVLRVFNDYLGDDGGYVAIYTRKKNLSVYQCGKEDIYVVALLRVKGKYMGSTCVPTGYKRGERICSDPELVSIALKYLGGGLTANDIWLGGDTGGFAFGSY
jgi:hypothetical protein